MIAEPVVRAPEIRWERTYSGLVVLIDLIIIAVALRVGLVLTDGSLAGHLPGFIAAVTGVILLVSTLACGAWEPRILGSGAEEFRRRVELAAVNEAAGPLFTLRRDPRVTGVGRLLRRYSLDALPQLVNILVGQMSLVGPRPPLPAELERCGADARRRLLVKPGLTGLWQVSGRSELSWEETVRLDLRYVENWSLAMDAAIFWRTAGAVLGGRGAY